MNKYSKIAADLNIGPLRGSGNIGLEDNPGQILRSQTVDRFEAVISVTVGALTVIAFIWFVIKILSGGIGILSAGGDKGKVSAARDDISYGVIGLVIVVSAIFIAGLIGAIIGVDILNIGEAFDRLDAIAP